MKNYRSRAELKKEVKNLLKRRWTTGVLLYLIPLLITGAGNTANNHNPNVKFVYGSTDFYVNSAMIFKILAITGIVSFVLGVIFSLISISATFRGFEWVNDPELDVHPIKSNFTYFRSPDWWKLMLTYLLVNVFTFLWSLLLIVPGIIKGFSYSQTYFIYKDLNDRGLADDYSLTDYITKSKQLMRGNKWRYFVLQLSFMGWFILGAATVIGMLWVFPYYKLTMANFYKDLSEQNQDILGY